MSSKIFPNLYKRTSTGAIQQWSIAVTGRAITTTYGQVNGKLQTTKDLVKEGKNAGRKNATEAEEQAIKEAKSQWIKKKKSGYVESFTDAQDGKTDSVIEGGALPMLAKVFEEHISKVKYPVAVQPKLDGHRCIAVIDAKGDVTLWTRTRKRITSVPHIEEKLKYISKKMRLTTCILDGELWHPKINNENKPYIEIPLGNKGELLLIDEEDLPKLKGMKPNLQTNGYPAVVFNDPKMRGSKGYREMKYVHRLVLDDPDTNIDHANGNKLDARKKNLRPCGQSLNQANSKKKSTNTSGFKGVNYFKRDGNYQAQITVNYEKTHLGYFKNPEEAARAYDKYAFSIWGKFANLNFPLEHHCLSTFEELTSAARSKDPSAESLALQYHVYDTMSAHGFKDRIGRMADIYLWGGDIVQLVDTDFAKTEEDMQKYFTYHKNKGYEGSMVRLLGIGYENKRSHQLLKVKTFEDAEFQVVDVEEGRGKLQGHAGAFVVRDMFNGKEFRVKMSGETEKLKEYLQNKKKYIGRSLTVQFQGRTSDGVPRFPVGLRFWEKL